MHFKKGQILTYSFPSRQTQNVLKSNVIKDYHRVVVLHKRETPFRTILIAPITKASTLTSKRNIPSNYVELDWLNYPAALEEKSYINLDMTMPVDEVELNTLFKGNFEISAHLNEADLYQLDYKIALTYELNKFLQTEFALHLKEELEHVISFIDEDIKMKMEEITRNINDSTIQNELIKCIS